LDWCLGPDENKSNYLLNVHPVIPISLNDDYNLILRTIVPINATISQRRMEINAAGFLVEMPRRLSFIYTESPPDNFVVPWRKIYLNTRTCHCRVVQAEIPVKIEINIAT